jgi:MFS family permease
MTNPVLLVAAFCVALVLSLLGFMAPAAVLGDIIAAWELTNTEAGWLGGALFAGYIATVPVLTALTDRVDPKRIYLVSAAVAVAGNLGFGFVADGLWSGAAFRILTGIGLAGTYMPGLKALTDQLVPGKPQQRGATYYTSVFALGSGLSILAGGLAGEAAGWNWAFAVAAAGSAGALLIVAVVLPARRPAPVPEGSAAALDFRPVLRDRAVMGYVLSFLGIAWEVFASRIWFVGFFAFAAAAASGGQEEGWSPAMLATAVALLGVPAAMGFGELAVLIDRRRLLIGVAAISALLAVAIGLTAGVSYELSVALCLLFGMFSYGRNSATTAGTISVADPARRGATLAVQAFIGFSGGILGPLAFGIALDAAGGGDTVSGWRAAACVMAVGPLLSVAALVLLRPARGP